MHTAPAFTDIEAAAARIAAVCCITPLLESPALNQRMGGRLLLKAEGLQHTGSFKLRGAYNCLALLTPAQRARGVVAYSSGNHAQAVAYAARLLGCSAVIVMPRDAPAVKRERTAALGAELVLYDRYRDDRVAIAARLASERELTLVPPFEHPHVIAGAGTLGLELVTQAGELQLTLDELLVPCSGGGLIAGCALALQARSPGTRIWSVEPAGLDDTARSLRSGERVANRDDARSVCDSLLVSTPGALTFSINRRLLAGGKAVSDAQALAAVELARRELNLLLEPGGAVALAAVFANAHEYRHRTIAVVLSGSNAD